MTDGAEGPQLAALPLFHRVAGRAVLVEGEGEPAEAKRRLVREAGATPVDRPAPGVQLAFLAAPEGASDAEMETEERRVGKECRSRWSPYH